MCKPVKLNNALVLKTVPVLFNIKYMCFLNKYRCILQLALLYLQFALISNYFKFQTSCYIIALHMTLQKFLMSS